MGFSTNGTTTSAYEELYDYQDMASIGFFPLCIIKNTGLNSMTARISTTSAFGGGENQDEIVILTATVLNLQEFVNNPLSTQQPMSRIRVEVKSTVGILPTTYDLRVIAP